MLGAAVVAFITFYIVKLLRSKTRDHISYDEEGTTDVGSPALTDGQNMIKHGTGKEAERVSDMPSPVPELAGKGAHAHESEHETHEMSSQVAESESGNKWTGRV